MQRGSTSVLVVGFFCCLIMLFMLPLPYYKAKGVHFSQPLWQKVFTPSLSPANIVTSPGSLKEQKTFRSQGYEITYPANFSVTTKGDTDTFSGNGDHFFVRRQNTTKKRLEEYGLVNSSIREIGENRVLILDNNLPSYEVTYILIHAGLELTIYGKGITEEIVASIHFTK